MGNVEALGNFCSAHVLNAVIRDQWVSFLSAHVVHDEPSIGSQRLVLLLLNPVKQWGRGEMKMSKSLKFLWMLSLAHHDGGACMNDKLMFAYGIITGDETDHETSV